MIRKFISLENCGPLFKLLDSNCFSAIGKKSVGRPTCRYSSNILHPLTKHYLIPESAFLTSCRYLSQKNELNVISKCEHESIPEMNELSDKSSHTLDPGESEVGDLFDNINYDEITGSDKETVDKFKLLLLEVEVFRQDGLRVPDKLTTDQWKELFNLKSRNQRLKLLNFLWTKQVRKLGDERKKERKRLLNEEKKAEFDKFNATNEHIRYGFQGNTIFVRVYDSAINSYDNSRLMLSMLYGPDIVIDCGYHKDMNAMENKLCAKQLCYMFAENRLHSEPFNLHFCNMNRESILFERFKDFIPTLDDPAFPVNITDKHYLDLFPKEKLVYLTPHCRNELKEFNHDDIYIVGALVDRCNQAPLSMAKAKSEGIRMAQLPLDRYLDWGLGNKSLTINQVINIMLDVRVKKDWKLALQHVPQRKVRSPDTPYKDPRKFYNRGTTFQPRDRRHIW